jgi:hypothetical protein
MRSPRSTPPRSSISAVREGWSRLVEQQHLGLEHQRARQRHPLGLAARQRAGRPPGEGADAQALEPVPDAPPGGVPGDAPEAEAERDVGGDAGVGQQRLLEHRGHAPPRGQGVARVHRATADQHLPGVGTLQQPQHPQQRGLAAAVGADDRQHLAGCHVERGHLEREAAVAAAHVAERDHRRHAGSTWMEPRWIENSQRRSCSMSRIS